MKRTKRTGLTLAEILVATALMGALLAAVAAAMNATFRGYSENEKVSSATQAARNVLNRLSAEARQCDDADITSSSLTLKFLDVNKNLTQTKYELRNGTLYYTAKGSPQEYVLLGDGDRARVTSFVVSRVTGPDPQNPAQSCTTAITVTLTLSVDNQTLTVTASAAPRRNQLF